MNGVPPVICHCSIHNHHCLFLFVRQSRRNIVVKKDGWGLLQWWLFHAVHALFVLLQVPMAVEASGAEVTRKWALPSVDDGVSCELRAALLVYATDVTQKALWQARPIGVDNLAVPF